MSQAFHQHLQTELDGIRAAGLWPEQPMEQSMGCSLSMATDGLYDHFREGRIRPRITGEAYITAEATLIFDPADPFRAGVRA